MNAVQPSVSLPQIFGKETMIAWKIAYNWKVQAGLGLNIS
jgi:hypothetical protein